MTDGQTVQAAAAAVSTGTHQHVHSTSKAGQQPSYQVGLHKLDILHLQEGSRMAAFGRGRVEAAGEGGVFAAARVAITVLHVFVVPCLLSAVNSQRLLWRPASPYAPAALLRLPAVLQG
jgi:hypothetical protein